MLNVMDRARHSGSWLLARLGQLIAVVLASANPEDYTNCVASSPRAQRPFGAEDPDDINSTSTTRWRSSSRKPISPPPSDVHHRDPGPVHASVRTSSVGLDHVWRVSARFSIACAETAAAAALHRAALLGEDIPVARVVDLESVIEVLRGRRSSSSPVSRDANWRSSNTSCASPSPTPCARTSAASRHGAVGHRAGKR